MNLLSLLRLGLDLGCFPGVDRTLLEELLIQTQPAHLQRVHTEKLSADERDLLRSDMLRVRLAQIPRPMVPPPGPAEEHETTV
jgi:protein arginine kinase